MTSNKSPVMTIRRRLCLCALLLLAVTAAGFLFGKNAAAGALGTLPSPDQSPNSTLIQLPTLRSSAAHDEHWGAADDLAAEAREHLVAAAAADGSPTDAASTLAVAGASDVALLVPPLGGSQSAANTAMPVRSSGAAMPGAVMPGAVAGNAASGSPVPEPESLVLIGVASLGLYLVGRRWSRQH
jgi:hypothetical protein